MYGTILIVDDEKSLVRHLTRLLQRERYHVSTAHTAAMARHLMDGLDPDVVLMDLRLPDADGSELMTELKEAHPETQFIIITAHGTIPSAVASTRRGAFDYLTKPFDPGVLMLSVKNALRGRVLGEEVRRLRSSSSGKLMEGSVKEEERRFPTQITRQTFALARRAAKQDGIVLLLGDSGSGKDYLARWIHERSRRAKGPFFDLNCATLPRDLAESELFGHEPGAFTGSRKRKRGLLELAENGTLLLNEIGELSLPLQSKLLTFLDTRSFIRLGGEHSITVDARIMAATNRDLSEAVSQNLFRTDLYYRINVFPIQLPPLRERLDDLPGLADTLLERLTGDLGLDEQPTLTADALEALTAYHWPGNIRELRNVLERAIMLSDSSKIRRSQLSIQASEREWRLEIPFEPGRHLDDITQQASRQLIIEALRRADTKSQAATLLGISRHSLSRRLKVLSINS